MFGEMDGEMLESVVSLEEGPEQDSPEATKANKKTSA
jgi:hypothetical protein